MVYVGKHRSLDYQHHIHSRGGRGFGFKTL